MWIARLRQIPITAQIHLSCGGLRVPSSCLACGTDLLPHIGTQSSHNQTPLRPFWLTTLLDLSQLVSLAKCTNHYLTKPPPLDTSCGSPLRPHLALSHMLHIPLFNLAPSFSHPIRQSACLVPWDKGWSFMFCPGLPLWSEWTRVYWHESEKGSI